MVCRAICSALDQTLAPTEVIVVDDGTPQPIPLKALPDDKRVHLIRLEANLGPAAARNAGIAVAKGEWIAFLDSDDFWYPNKLATQSKLAQTVDDQDRVVFVTGWATIREGRISSMIAPRGANGLHDFALGCWFCPGSTSLLHRSVFELVGPFDADLRRLEDYEWHLRFGRVGGRLAVTDQAMAGISWSAKKPTDSVDSAIRSIAERYLDSGSSDYLLDREARNHMRAYLKLVQASVLWYANRKLSALPRFVQSLVANPRLTVQNCRLHRALPIEVVS